MDFSLHLDTDSDNEMQETNAINSKHHPLKTCPNCNSKQAVAKRICQLCKQPFPKSEKCTATLKSTNVTRMKQYIKKYSDTMAKNSNYDVIVLYGSHHQRKLKNGKEAAVFDIATYATSGFGKSFIGEGGMPSRPHTGVKVIELLKASMQAYYSRKEDSCDNIDISEDALEATEQAESNDTQTNLDHANEGLIESNENVIEPQSDCDNGMEIWSEPAGLPIASDIVSEVSEDGTQAIRQAESNDTQTDLVDATDGLLTNKKVMEAKSGMTKKKRDCSAMIRPSVLKKRKITKGMVETHWKELRNRTAQIFWPPVTDCVEDSWGNKFWDCEFRDETPNEVEVCYSGEFTTADGTRGFNDMGKCTVRTSKLSLLKEWDIRLIE